MLKVAHIGKFYSPVRGGMERAVELVCRETRDRLEHEVLAFNTVSSSTVERIDGITVRRLGTWVRAGSVPIAPGLLQRLRRLEADLAVIHEPNPWALVAWAAAAPRIPVVIWFHSEVVRPAVQYDLFYAPLASRVYPQARRFIVSSPRLGSRAAALKPFQDRIAVVPFGVDPRALSNPAIEARAADLRREFPGWRLLFGGRLVPYKGIDVLIDAVAPLPVTLTVAGDGPMREQWMRHAARAAGRARIVFTGELPEAELRAWMQACDALVLPSVTRAEAFGLVQLEAMACGKPVISTDLPTGVPWVNLHELTGLVVPPADVGALRAAVTALIGDGGMSSRMGQAGAERVAREFTLRAMGDRFVSVCLESAEAGRA